MGNYQWSDVNTFVQASFYVCFCVSIVNTIKNGKISMTALLTEEV